MEHNTPYEKLLKSMDIGHVSKLAFKKEEYMDDKARKTVMDDYAVGVNPQLDNTEVVFYTFIVCSVLI